MAFVVKIQKHLRMRNLLLAFVLLFSMSAFAQETRSIYYASHMFERLEAGTFKQIEQKASKHYLYLETTLGVEGREMEDFKGALKVFPNSTDNSPMFSLSLDEIVDFQPQKGIYIYAASALVDGEKQGELYVFIHGGEDGVEDLAVIGTKEVMLFKLMEIVD